MVGILKTRRRAETKELHLSSSILPREIERGIPEVGVVDQLEALPRKTELVRGVFSCAG
jgi:hypothetical protein